MTTLGHPLSRITNRIRGALAGRSRRDRRSCRPRVEALEEKICPAVVYDFKVTVPQPSWAQFVQDAGPFEADNLQRLAGMELALDSSGDFAMSIPNNYFSPLSGHYTTDGQSIRFSYANSVYTYGGVTAFALDGIVVESKDGTVGMGLNYRSGNDLAAVVDGTGYGSSVSNAFRAVVELTQVSGPALNLTPFDASQPTPAAPAPTPPGPVAPAPTPPAGTSPAATPAPAVAPQQPPTGDVTGLIGTAVHPAVGKKARASRGRWVTVQVTNNSRFDLPSVRMVLSGLKKGIKLRGAAGKTSSGAPFVTLSDLKPGETREVVLGFQNQGGAPVHFQTQFVA